MRHTSRRRSQPDPLAPQPERTWLVVRDRTRAVLESQELAPGVDPRPVLAAVREARSASGWACEDMGSVSAGSFCSREGERLYVGIERADPTRRGPF
jgi:hypothetical protein